MDATARPPEGIGSHSTPVEEGRASCRLLRLVAITLVIPMLWVAAGARGQESATIHGTVRDVAGAPVGDARVRLDHGGTPAAETRTSADGDFTFSGVAPGSYTVIAEKSGWLAAQTSISADGLQSQRVDLRMHMASVESSSSTPSGMEFADEPNFTIAAVTDWTAAGGHGSDTVLRASEALNREAISLKPEAKAQPPGPATEASEEKALQASLAKAPEQFATNYALGAFYLAAARNSDAVPPLEASYRIRPDDFANELDLAEALQGAGDIAGARKHVGNLMARGENADVDRLAGELDEKLGDSLTAVKELERAVHQDPSERNYFEWGSELLLHRAVLQAKEVFAAGVKAHPESERMLTALGAALFAGALYDEAAQRLCAASDLNFDDVDPYLFMGRIVVAVSSPMPCVLPRLKRFSERQPENPLASYYYAMAIWKQNGQPVDKSSVAPVEALLHRAVILDNKCAVAWLQLGVLSYSRRDYQDAVDFFRRATSADPQFGEAHYRLGMAYDRMGERDQAKAELDLHEKIEREQKEKVERQRRTIKQFRVLDAGEPSSP
ncbi:MAG: carboxypeptidase regulatory-like domain-containing protein [Acidobacteriaceae bacterium]